MSNVLAAVKTVIQARSGHELLENYGPLLRTGLDKAFQRVAKFPVQGEKFFTSSTESKGYKKFQGKTGLGLMVQSRDNDLMPKTSGGLGFAYEISSIGYRMATSVERELLEREQYGMIGKDQRELATSAKRTIELILADVFNRGLGGVAYGDPYAVTGLAQFTCEDGAYLISTTRNQPVAAAGNWSNRLPDVAFTAGGNNDALMADLIRDAKLAAKQYVNDEGILSPMMVKRMIVSPVLEDTAMRVTGTKLIYSGDITSASDRFSDQAVNTITGTPYEVYDWLSDGLIYFELEGENELELLWRVKPSVMIYDEGNPDMINQRVRMSMGTGCPRPTTWIGCSTTGTDNL